MSGMVPGFSLNVHLMYPNDAEEKLADKASI